MDDTLSIILVVLLICCTIVQNINQDTINKQKDTIATMQDTIDTQKDTIATMQEIIERK